jgi:trimethylamine:corrinoid methyltransferase-like protein
MKEEIVKTVNSVIFPSPQFAVLSDTQLQDLHLAALEVLRRTGIRFYHQEALAMLKEAGAFVSDGNLKFPARLVEDAVASTPGRIIMCDRDGQPAVFLEGAKVYFGTGSDCLNLLDPETGEHRKFTQTDLINSYHLCDALPNIHFVMSNGVPSEVDLALTYDVQMALMLENTTKPIVFVTNDKASCQRAIDMAAAVAGGYEALMESGLTLSYEMIVLTDELVAMTDHIMKGIEVNDDTLTLDELDKVGPGGHFMDTKQTLKRFRDFWFPGLLDRKTRPKWLEAGATTLGQRLNARVKEIIREHRPKPLDPGKKRRVQETLAQAG